MVAEIIVLRLKVEAAKNSGVVLRVSQLYKPKQGAASQLKPLNGQMKSARFPRVYISGAAYSSDVFYCAQLRRSR